MAVGNLPLAPAFILQKWNLVFCWDLHVCLYEKNIKLSSMWICCFSRICKNNTQCFLSSNALNESSKSFIFWSNSLFPHFHILSQQELSTLFPSAVTPMTMSDAGRSFRSASCCSRIRSRSRRWSPFCRSPTIRMSATAPPWRWDWPVLAPLWRMRSPFSNQWSRTRCTLCGKVRWSRWACCWRSRTLSRVLARPNSARSAWRSSPTSTTTWWPSSAPSWPSVFLMLAAGTARLVCRREPDTTTCAPLLDYSSFRWECS